MVVLIVFASIISGILLVGAVTAWGVVQVLDIMEALDLRREAKKVELRRAREFLGNPTKGGMSSSMSSGYSDNISISNTQNTGGGF